MDVNSDAIDAAAIRKELAFPVEEYRDRLRAVRSRMAARNLNAMLVTIPENICYLTGFRTPGYYYPIVLVVTHSEDPRLVVRNFEFRNIEAYSWLDPTKCVAFSDSSRPMDAVIEIINSMGADRGLIGVEFNAWYHTVENHLQLVEQIGAARIVNAAGTVEAERAVKSPREIAYIRQACRISELGIRAAQAQLARGPQTENDLAAAIHFEIVRHGSEWPGLPLFLSSGRRSQIPHATWSDKPICAGENVICELTGVVRRYAGPLFRTFWVGDVPPPYRARALIVREMLDAVIDAIRPGRSSDEVNSAAVKASGAFGGAVIKRAGYSVGLNFPPDWGEGTFLDLKHGDATILKAGMVFHLPQSLRSPGELPVAISETVLVTEQGHEVLTSLERDLIQVRW